MDEPRLELAAALGHEPSRLVTGSASASPGWCARTPSGLDRGTRVRLALAVARAVALSSPRDAHDADVAAAVSAIERWILCPCHEHAVSAAECLERLPLEAAARRRRFAFPARAVVITYHVLCGFHDEGGVVGGPDLDAFSFDAFADLAALARAVGDEGDVRSAVAEELVPYLLGHSDPVRERVEGREAR